MNGTGLDLPVLVICLAFVLLHAQELCTPTHVVGLFIISNINMLNVATLSPGSQEGFLLDDVYLFKDGVEEFTHPPGMPQKTWKTAVKKFLSAGIERPVYEFPLQMFGTWFIDLPLSDVMTFNDSPNCGEVWQYKVILLFPQIVPTKKRDREMFDWAVEAATAFYISSFSVHDDDAGCINLAVLAEPTIMVVGRPVVKREDAFKKSVVGCEDAVVISCITFRNGTGDECGSSLVLWLLVAPDDLVSHETLPVALKPSYISSWRRQGFGRLMLIMLIKRSTFALLCHQNRSFCQERVRGVDIYLQVGDQLKDDAMAFYLACGFVRINDEDTTGLELLPQTINSSLVGEMVSNYAWIQPESDEHIIFPLMRLRSGSLLNSAIRSRSDKEIYLLIEGSEGTSSFVWCQYPPPLLCPLNAVPSALLVKEDLEAAYAGLDLLNTLVPPPMGNLPRRNHIRGGGRIASLERLFHSKKGGTAWVKDDQLQTMIALLLKDGRYDASVAVISLTDAQMIKACVEVLQSHVSAKKHRNNLMEAKSKELSKKGCRG